MDKNPDLTFEQMKNMSYESYYHIILKPFTGNKEINGWKFEMESMMGTFLFMKTIDDKEICVYGTPHWEGIQGISLQFTDYSDNYIKLASGFPSAPTGDSRVDSDKYFELMENVLKWCDNYA